MAGNVTVEEAASHVVVLTVILGKRVKVSLSKRQVILTHFDIL